VFVIEAVCYSTECAHLVCDIWSASAHYPQCESDESSWGEVFHTSGAYSSTNGDSTNAYSSARFCPFSDLMDQRQ
jgi:hypothetical protein